MEFYDFKHLLSFLKHSHTLFNNDVLAYDLKSFHFNLNDRIFWLVISK